jgi:hypothetical protein
VRHSGKLNIKMEQLDECIGCETGAECDWAHRGEDGKYFPECCTRAAELERVTSKDKTELPPPPPPEGHIGIFTPPEYASLEAALHILKLEDQVNDQQKQIEELQRELEQEKKRFPTFRRPIAQGWGWLTPEDMKDDHRETGEALLKYMERVEQTRELPLGAIWRVHRENYGATIRIQTIMRGRCARRLARRMRWLRCS